MAEGFSELEEVAYIELAELATIDGLDDELAEELQSRAAEALERREAAAREQRQALGVEDALAEIPHLTEAMLVTLGMAGIILPLDRATLSVALGRDNVVHLALADRGASTRLDPLVQRLLHYLGTGPAGTDAPEAASAVSH